MAHIEFFKKSGRPAVAYMQSGGEKEYAIAAACGEVYVPPTAQLALRGLSVQGQFLRGVLDKVGVEPQVRFFCQCMHALSWRVLSWRSGLFLGVP